MATNCIRAGRVVSGPERNTSSRRHPAGGRWVESPDPLNRLRIPIGSPRYTVSDSALMAHFLNVETWRITVAAAGADLSIPSTTTIVASGTTVSAGASTGDPVGRRELFLQDGGSEFTGLSFGILDELEEDSDPPKYRSLFGSIGFLHGRWGWDDAVDEFFVHMFGNCTALISETDPDPEVDTLLIGRTDLAIDPDGDELLAEFMGHPVKAVETVVEADITPPAAPTLTLTIEPETYYTDWF